jgi:LacI family transcriptional regulator
MTARRYRVALAVPQGLAFLERLLHGIAEFARGHGSWTFTRVPEALGTSATWLRHWSGDGAFVLAVTGADVRGARGLPFPVVNLASHRAETGLPTVVVDHGQVGEVAAGHLIERRFQRFGYYGTAGLWYSRLRRDGFSRAVARAGGSCQVLEPRVHPGARGSWRDETRQLDAWLRRLRAPVGIMASTDLRAGMVLEACRRLGLRVPQEVAVVGVDNDPVFAEFSEPPLTSVSRNDHEVGRKAAELLAALMGAPRAGRRRPQACVLLVPPDGVIQRGSTATVAIEDPVIGRAVQYIGEHLGETLRIPVLLKAAPLSRRAFEYRFRAAMGLSPADYILRARIDAAQALLADPASKIATVGAACGFASARRFRQAFVRRVGQTPSRFRRALGERTAATRVFG